MMLQHEGRVRAGVRERGKDTQPEYKRGGGPMISYGTEEGAE